MSEALSLSNDVGRTPEIAVEEVVVRFTDGSEKRLVVVDGEFVEVGVRPDVPRRDRVRLRIVPAEAAS